MKKRVDNLEQLFRKFENQWDVQEINPDHQVGFLQKLNAKQPKKNYFAIWTIAASIVLFLGIAIFYNNEKPKEFRFASRETKRTDSIFGILIHTELAKLQEKSAPENKQIISDALKQMKVFDADYDKIIKELQKNGENKQIIKAMISNLQTRISFLQTVLQRIEENENLKNTTDEKNYNLLLLLFLIPLFGIANDGTFIVKQKNIKKTYVVNPNAGINIENKYGNITISTWDEDKIDLDITIKVTGENENWVNEKLNSIDVNITALKSLVSAVTILENTSLKSKGSSNSFEINYILKIPKNGTVKLNNKYGNISAISLESTTDITCKYGKVILGKLNGANNKLAIEYCQNSNIDYIKSGTITARYSGLQINDAGNINLDANYTDVTIQEGQNIQYDCNYGTFEFQKIASFTGSGNYLTLSIGEISNNLSFEGNYSKITVNTLKDKANNVNINTGYTNITLGYDVNYTFDFDIIAKYTKIKSDDSLAILINENKSNTKRISGYHKKKGSNKVVINSNYGNVTLLKKQ